MLVVQKLPHPPSELYPQAIPHSNSIRRPIFFLPNELVSEIFLHGASDDASFGINVSHVSRYFRDVALSTPALWTRIVFKENAKINKADEYLRRSRSAGLDVHIRWSTMANLSALRAEEAIAMLYPHVSRITRLEFWSWNHTVLEYLLKSLRGSTAARLKSLIIHVTDRQAFVIDYFMASEAFSFKSHPLETISMGISAFNTMKPPLGRVKSVLLKEEEGSSFPSLQMAVRKVLKDATGLQKLAIVALWRPVMPSWEPIRGKLAPSHTLKVLRLSDFSLSGVQCIFQLINPSNLTHLTIDHSRFTSIPNHTFSFFPPLPRLTCLEMRATEFISSDLLVALRKMESLNQLWLESCNLDHQFIKGLEETCPLLSDLVLVSNIPYNEIQGKTPWQALQRMIRRRQENGRTANIRRLKVREQFGEYEHIEAIDNLLKLVPDLIVV